MNRQYNVWCKWHKLKTVMLGNLFLPEFFDSVKNDKIKSALKQITEETHENLANYEAVLKSFGCQVIRPYLDPKSSIEDYAYHNKVQRVPRPPLQPRDAHVVIGNQMYYGVGDHPALNKAVKRYNSNVVDLPGLNCEAPNFTLVGKDLYADLGSSRLDRSKITTEHLETIKKINPEIRVNQLTVGGHTDGCFHTLKKGAILSLHDIQRYENTFPGWDVCYLPNQSWHLVEGFTKMKAVVGGKWWVPGQEDNKDFIFFVETWLEDWVGYCEESVFDVNVLMLDEHNVCVSNYNKEAFDFFKKHKIEPTIVPWKHRYFWDGGLHCITLDLYREGKMENYFPDRKEPIMDEGYD